jgi:3-dehydroquinate synthase
MVDSAVGGKVGLNHPLAKNLIGAFHQPIGVWIDTRMLESLPEREFRSGLAEVVKYGVILDPKFFTYLETKMDRILRRESEALRHIISRSCTLKAKIVQEDERDETGRRAILNYGHTFGHAFETIAGYGNLRHGEAIAMGMTCAVELALDLGVLRDEALPARQSQLLAHCGLPTRPPKCSVAEVLQCMLSDKKTTQEGIQFVLPRKLGQVELVAGILTDTVARLLEKRMRA